MKAEKSKHKKNRQMKVQRKSRQQIGQKKKEKKMQIEEM